MADKFIPPPYNYCDYRCSECEGQENCRVYKDDQERVMDHFRRGEDPYDPKIFMNDIKEICKNTEEMIHKCAEEEGIELDQAQDEEMPDVNAEDYAVYRQAFEYFERAHAFIKDLQRSGIPDGMQLPYEDLMWYHTLIAAKAGRLVSGFIDDLLEEDIRSIEEQGTIAVIRKGIKRSQAALDNMLGELPNNLEEIAGLLDILGRIERQLDTDIRGK